MVMLCMSTMLSGPWFTLSGVLIATDEFEGIYSVLRAMKSVCVYIGSLFFFLMLPSLQER